MNLLKLWLPIILAGAVIVLAAQYGTTPETPAWLAKYVELETVGHLALYMFLGLFVARYFSAGLGVGPIGTLVLTAAISVAFGVSDEVHQMFVVDRKAEFGDLAPDLIGGLSGALIYLWGSFVTRAIREWNCITEVRAGLIAGVIAVMVSTAVLVAGFAVIHAGALGPVMGSMTREAIDRYLPTHSGARTESSAVPLARASAGPQEAPSNAAAPHEVSTRELDEDLIRSVLRDFVHEMKKELSKEVRKELVNEITQARGAAGSSAVDPSPAAAVADRIVNSDTEWNAAAAKGADISPAVITGARNKILAALRNNSGLQSRGQGSLLGSVDRQPERCDLVAVLAHPSNPVRELTLDQVRKLFSGEYVNWSQVGGPDLPVKVITVRKRNADVEENIKNHLKAPLSPDAVIVPLVSFIIPSVAQAKGAVGFLPVANVEQLDFVAGHSAFKRIAVKTDTEGPGRLPNRMALNTRTYPIMGEEPESKAP